MGHGKCCGNEKKDVNKAETCEHGEKPGECSPEKIKECHGETAKHPCC